MTNEELHAHFSALLVSRAEDVDTRLGEFDTKLTNAMDKIYGLEKSFNAKLDVRFKELLNRLTAPAPTPTHGARRITITGRTAGSAAAAPPAATAAATLGTDDGYYYDPTTSICSTRRLNNLHRYLLAVPDITTATLDHRYVMMIMLQSLN